MTDKIADERILEVLRGMDPSLLEDHQTDFLHGSCHVMALAMHQVTGLPLAAIWDPKDKEAIHEEGGLVHFFVMADDDLGFDVMGLRSCRAMASDFGVARRFSVTLVDEGTVVGLSGPHDDEVEEAVAMLRSRFPGLSAVTAPTP